MNIGPPNLDLEPTWIEAVHPSTEPTRYRELLAFRQRHLREPLGLSFTDADVAAEADHIHLGLHDLSGLIGSIVLVPPDPSGTGKIRQMAIVPMHRHRGLGASLVRHAEAEFRRLGATGVSLHARADAVDFYRRLGYRTEGDMFTEVTILHLRMNKRLNSVTIS